MRLLAVELNRFRSRRAVVLIVLAAAMLAAFILGTELWNTRPITAEDRAVAEARAQTDAELPGFQQELESCQESPEAYLGPGGTAADCEATMMPRAEWYLDRTPLELSNVLQGAGLALILMTTALLIICGATYAGADWATGSMSNQVLFEPRRAKVWLAKALTVFLGAMLVTAVLLAAFWVVVHLVAQARGIGTPDRVWHDIWWYGGRGVVLAGAAALGGYALTMLMRSTVATLAVLFAYSVGGEALVLALPLHKATQWSLANNVFAWVKDGTEVFDPDIVCQTEMCVQSYVLGVGHAAAYLGALLVIALVASALSFRHRDIP